MDAFVSYDGGENDDREKEPSSAGASSHAQQETNARTAQGNRSTRGKETVGQIYFIETEDPQFVTLPTNVIASWKAEDWDDETMTASRYTYEDADTGEPVELTEDEAAEYAWGPTDDHGAGGSQGGRLMEPRFEPTHVITLDNGWRIEVQVVDGAAYTRAEWYATDQADYTCQDNGEWLFQGQPFAGTVVRL